MVVDSLKGKRGKAEPPIHPSELAADLERSIRSDHESRSLHPDLEKAGSIFAAQDEAGRRRALPLDAPEATLARWARPLGIEAELGVPKGERWPLGRLAAAVAERISPHPARFDELASAAREFEAYLLRREGGQLRSCGTPWGRIVRLFWQDRKGRLVMRQRGIHSCKHRWCPRCGKPRQNRLSNEIERTAELAREWGFGEQCLRFLTLTIKNGKDVTELRQEAHEAWARLQRTRWWPRHVFGWFRGTEVVTGEDGNWNLHIHIVLMLWANQLSYSAMWDAWQGVVGERAQIDIQTLADHRRKARGRGTTRAARYIVKYIAKREVMANLRKGPGGLAHLFSSTRRLRFFAVGGGCSVLRRLLPVLMPSWALRAERALAGAELRDGREPVRAEEVDPETGEVLDIPPPVPFPDPVEREAWTSLAARLADDAGTVGQACGPGKRFRRLGAVPLPSTVPKVKQWTTARRDARRAQEPPSARTHLRWSGRGAGRRPVPVRVSVRTPRLRMRLDRMFSGVRGVILRIAGWRLFNEQNRVKVYKPDASGKRVATGETRLQVFRAVLPRARFAWKFVAREVWAALLGDTSPWAILRREAVKAWGRLNVQPGTGNNHLRALAVALDDRVTFRFAGVTERTTRRAIQGEELINAFARAVQRDSKAVWDEAVLNLRRNGLRMLEPGILLQRNEDETTRALRALVTAEAGGF